jgi:ABC-type dipeptide/oligopeptide/nickel transport system ATPase component
MILQEPQAALDPLASIGSQIAEALRQPLSRARPAVRKMLEDVGISDPERRIDQRPFELSGGMCQRVMIASALISRPTILIADEPTTALDVTIQAQILDLLRHLAIERHTAVVLITHDMGVVADIADHLAIMYAGRIAEAGPTEAIFAAPRHPYTRALLSAVPIPAPATEPGCPYRRRSESANPQRPLFIRPRGCTLHQRNPETAPHRPSLPHCLPPC